MNNDYYVVMKENHTISNIKQVDEIQRIELPTPEKRFPIGSKFIESYCTGSEIECEAFIKSLPKSIADLFEVTRDE